jgi:hypothetical protein
MGILGVPHRFSVDLRWADNREYTIDVDGEVSWRIEVALRAVLLATEEEKLHKFLAGYYDGAPEQAQVNDVLRGILVGKVQQCERVLAVKWSSCVEGDLVEKLWEGELSIARKALEILTR